MLKKTILFFITIVLIATKTKTLTLNDAPYHQQAQTWAATYLYDESAGTLMITHKELQLITNLCYFSLQRSLATLNGQTAARNALTHVWHGWQNIAHTRLDPSKQLPHTITQQEKEQTLTQFWSMHDHCRLVGTTYTHAVNTVVQAHTLETASALRAVQLLRESTRALVAQTLTDIRSYLGNLFYNPRDGLIKSYGPVTRKNKIFSLLDYIWDYVPKLAVYSFSEADTLNNTVSEESWKTLEAIQQVGSQTWQAIEKARGSFYLAHYKVLHAIMEHADLDDRYTTIMFDQYGMIAENKRNKKLPPPLS